MLLVLGADGKGIMMRPEVLRSATRKAAAGMKRGRDVFRTRLASGEKPCRKRMAALGRAGGGPSSGSTDQPAITRM